MDFMSHHCNLEADTAAFKVQSNTTLAAYVESRSSRECVPKAPPYAMAVLWQKIVYHPGTHPCLTPLH
jgi:hypothetical protein